MIFWFIWYFFFHANLSLTHPSSLVFEPSKIIWKAQIPTKGQVFVSVFDNGKIVPLICCKEEDPILVYPLHGVSRVGKIGHPLIIYSYIVMFFCLFLGIERSWDLLDLSLRLVVFIGQLVNGFWCQQESKSFV